MNELADIIHEMNNLATMWYASGHESQAEEMSKLSRRLKDFHNDHPELSDEDEEDDDEDDDIEDEP